MTLEAQKQYSEYQKEFDELHDKYLEPYIYTEEDAMHPSYIRRGINKDEIIGRETKRYPKQPSDNGEAYELFKKYYCQLQFIAHQMIYSQEYGVWSLENVEAEISELERFIKSTYGIQIEHPDLTQSYYLHDGIEIEYRKLKDDYYSTHRISDDVWSLN